MQKSIHHVFRVAGWNPGRRVAVTEGVPNDHPAYQVLAEFGGLTVGATGRGEECATSNVAFRQIDREDSFVQSWCELLQATLIGVADVHNAHSELYVDNRGRWFLVNLMNDTICFTGSSFAEAMERLLLGLRCRPMLRPGQYETSMYGETFKGNDPRVYQYR